MNELPEIWKEDGYYIGHRFIDETRAARVRAICEQVFAQWRKRDALTGEPGGDGTAISMRCPHHPDYFEGDSPLGRADLRELLELGADPKILDLVRELLGEEILFRGMSFFINPSEGGRNGHWHRDTQFLWKAEDEERKVLAEMPPEGTSVQLQIAFVPSDAMEVVPRSQNRWDTPEEYYIRRQDNRAHWTSDDMPGAMRADLGIGDLVAFNPAILHRGRYDVESPRRTMLFAYTPVSLPRVDKASHQPWFLRPGYLDGLSAEAREFYERFVEQYRDSWS